MRCLYGRKSSRIYFSELYFVRGDGDHTSKEQRTLRRLAERLFVLFPRCRSLELIYQYGAALLGRALPMAPTPICATEFFAYICSSRHFVTTI